MKKAWLITTLPLLIFWLAPPVFAQSIEPQYIFVRKDPTSCNPTDCSLLWNMDDPSKINLDSINDIFTKIGTKGNSANTRKVGIGVIFNYWWGDFEKQKLSLSTLLDYAKIHDVPLFLHFEGLVWWDKRPDLWNWWDPNAPGYNPENKNNVEWTCWNNSCAIQKSWRNWGTEFEVKPHPNLASQAFINATKEALQQFIPIVVEWHDHLSPEQRYLLGGISMGGEVDIGANYYYYPNGIHNGSGLPGSIQLGYAAVKTAGIKSSGTITTEDINEVDRRYQTALNKTVFELGIPRNKIFNHNGGKGAAPFIEYPPGVAFASMEATLGSIAQPGWSFYGDITSNPQNNSDLANVLNQLGNTQWAVPEWLTFAQDYDGWVSALRNSLNYRNNRFINIANWEGMVRDKPYVLDAIRTVANENPSCWVLSPTMNNVVISGNSVTLTWQSSPNASAQFVLISSIGEFTNDGILREKNIANMQINTETSLTKNDLPNGKYYWQLISDGCTNQRRVSEGSFVINSTSTSTIPGDLDTDGDVDIFDYNEIVGKFGNPYTIFDYNLVISMYGT